MRKEASLMPEATILANQSQLGIAESMDFFLFVRNDTQTLNLRLFEGSWSTTITRGRRSGVTIGNVMGTSK